MNAPLDEYEDDEDVGQGGSRAMSWLVLAIAVGGFAALAYYAYNSGTKAPGDGEVVTITADSSPIKAEPSAPDGEKFPNKDKTIYDAIAPDGEKTAEKLMPEPERPVAAVNIEDSEDNAPIAAAPKEIVAAVAAAKPVEPTTFVAPKPAAKEKPAAKPVAKPVVQEAPKPAEEKPAEATYAAPEMINEKPAVAAVEAPVAVEKPVEEVKAEKSAAKPARGGAYMVQLGSYKSDAEARAAWKKISGKFPSVLSGAPNIEKATLPKGVFYRLRAGSFASSDAAKAACAKMSGQACMAVK